MQLDTLQHIPISQLSPHVEDADNRKIRAIVTLLWPYSSSTRRVALLIAEPDYRLRRKRGQVRVELHGASAQAVARAKVGIGDELVLGLKGVDWVDNTRVEHATNTPGKSVNWDIRFHRVLQLEVFRENVPYAALDVDSHTPSPPSSPLDLLRNRSALPSTPLHASPDNDRYGSVLFKRTRLSGDGITYSPYDPFKEDERQSRKRLRGSWGGVGKWHVTSRTPSPARQGTLGLEEDDPGSRTTHQGSPVPTALKRRKSPNTTGIAAAAKSPERRIAATDETNVILPDYHVSDPLEADSQSEAGSRSFQVYRDHDPKGRTSTLLFTPGSPATHLSGMENGEEGFSEHQVSNIRESELANVNSVGETQPQGIFADHVDRAVDEQESLPIANESFNIVPPPSIAGLGIGVGVLQPSDTLQILESASGTSEVAQSSLTGPEQPTETFQSSPKELKKSQGRSPSISKRLTPNVILSQEGSPQIPKTSNRRHRTSSNSSRKSKNGPFGDHFRSKAPFGLSGALEEEAVLDQQVEQDLETERHVILTPKNQPDGPADIVLHDVQNTVDEPSYSSGLRKNLGTELHSPSINQDSDQEAEFHAAGQLLEERSKSPAEHLPVENDARINVNEISASSDQGSSHLMSIANAALQFPGESFDDQFGVLDQFGAALDQDQGGWVSHTNSDNHQVSLSFEPTEQLYPDLPMVIPEDLIHLDLMMDHSQAQAQPIDRTSTRVEGLGADHASVVVPVDVQETIKPTDAGASVGNVLMDNDQTPTPRMVKSDSGEDQASVQALKSKHRRISSDTIYPEAIRTWFTPRRASFESSQITSTEGREFDHAAPSITVDQTSQKSQTASSIFDSDPEVIAQARAKLLKMTQSATRDRVVTPVMSQEVQQVVREYESGSGLRTSLSYYTPLRPDRLRPLLNLTSSQHSNERLVDIIAVVTSPPKPVSRAEKGPRDWNTSLCIADPSSWAFRGDSDSEWPDGDVLVQCFKGGIKGRAMLPLANVGDVILLTDFGAVSQRGKVGLINRGPGSGWCVWKFGSKAANGHANGHGQVEEMRGAPIDVGPEERAFALKLREWWTAQQGASE